MNLNLEDQDAASQYVSTQIAGKTVQAIELCEGDEEHPAHVDITFSNGVVLYIVGMEPRETSTKPTSTPTTATSAS